MTELHTVKTGTSTGTTVLWLHGVDSDAHVWDAAVGLVSTNHRCIALDLPGHGESPAPCNETAYTRDAVLNDLDAVIDPIRAADPDERIVLVGHSLGGYLGMAHVLTRGTTARALNGLVLVSTGPGFRNPAARESWNERVRANASNYSVSEIAATIAFHVDSMVMDRITDLTLPIALVIGDGDKGFLAANDYLKKKLPQATRSTVEGARHFVMKSNPEAVAAAVATVIAELGR